MDYPLFTEEGETSQNQRGDKDQKENTFFLHFTTYPYPELKYLNIKPPNVLNLNFGIWSINQFLLQFKFNGDRPPLFHLGLFF